MIQMMTTQRGWTSDCLHVTNYWLLFNGVTTLALNLESCSVQLMACLGACGLTSRTRLTSDDGCGCTAQGHWSGRASTVPLLSLLSKLMKRSLRVCWCLIAGGRMVVEVRRSGGMGRFVCFAATKPLEASGRYKPTERNGHIGLVGKSRLRQERHGIGWRALGTLNDKQRMERVTPTS